MFESSPARRSSNPFNAAILAFSILLNLLVLTATAFPFVGRWPATRDALRYGVSEWLIDYSGGFVRRGLGGEIVGASSRVTGIAAHWIAIVGGAVVTAAVLLVLGRALWRIRKTLDPLRFAALAFSPLLIGFYLSNLQVLGRRDQLGILLTAIHLAILAVFARRVESDPKGALRFYIRTAGLLFLALGVPFVLCHEALLFLSLPLNLLLSYAALRRAGGARDLPPWATLYAPLLTAGAFCFARHGDAAVVQTIQRNWLDRGEEPAFVTAPGNIIQTLATTKGEALHDSVQILVHGGPIYLLLMVANLAVLRWALGGLPWQKGGTRFPNAVERRYLILPFLAALPLFALAVDWGRWLAILSAQYFLVATGGGNVPFLGEGEGREGNAGSPPTVSVLLGTALAVSLLFRLPFLWTGYPGVPWGTLPRLLFALGGLR